MWSNESLDSNFKAFSPYFPKVPQIQLVKELRREKTFPQGAEIRKASTWLSKMPYT